MLNKIQFKVNSDENMQTPQRRTWDLFTPPSPLSDLMFPAGVTENKRLVSLNPAAW